MRSTGHSTIVRSLPIVLALALAGSIPHAQSAGLDASSAAAANSGFAADLYRQLVSGDTGTNTFVSPFSLFNALAIVAEGADG